MRWRAIRLLLHLSYPPLSPFCDVICVSPYSLGRLHHTLIPAHCGPSFLPISPSPRSLRYICIFLYLHAISSCPYTHSLPWSVGRASIFFVLLFLLFLFSSLSLLSTCLLQFPTSLFASSFFFHNSRFSFFLRSLHRYCPFVCFQCTQRFIK
jgi:hypothetical protein